MLSMKAKYALRAMAVMARNEKKMFSSKTIAKEGDIPQKFLEAILLELKNHGIVGSKRGIFGGYFLAAGAQQISIGSIIRHIDGGLAPLPCASVHHYQKCEDCVDEASCQIRKTMIDVREAIAGVLDHRSIKDLVSL